MLLSHPSEETVKTNLKSQALEPHEEFYLSFKVN